MIVEMKGKELSQKIIEQTKKDINDICIKYNIIRQPSILVISIGYDDASNIYIRNKEKQCRNCGIIFYHQSFNEKVSRAEMIRYIQLANISKTFDAILIQQPLPEHLKGIEQYMENIIRQDIENPYITEIAFYKFLNKCGLSYQQIREATTFINKVAISNFVEIGNNNGWSEIVCQIPNKCAKLNLVTKEITEFPSLYQAEFPEGLFDNGNMQFVFDSEMKEVIDFEKITYEENVVNESFDFNCFLLFYRDAEGIDKLHGINFINNFDNKITYFDLPTFTQKTNDARSIGYQFKLNLKTVNNDATKLLVYELQEHSHWNTFSETLSRLNSFLERKMREEPIYNPNL